LIPRRCHRSWLELRPIPTPDVVGHVDDVPRTGDAAGSERGMAYIPERILIRSAGELNKSAVPIAVNRDFDPWSNPGAQSERSHLGPPCVRCCESAARVSTAAARMSSGDWWAPRASLACGSNWYASRAFSRTQAINGHSLSSSAVRAMKVGKSESPRWKRSARTGRVPGLGAGAGGWLTNEWPGREATRNSLPATSPGEGSPAPGPCREAASLAPIPLSKA
jgi:hypothetical protein